MPALRCAAAVCSRCRSLLALPQSARALHRARCSFALQLRTPFSCAQCNNWVLGSMVELHGTKHDMLRGARRLLASP